MNEAINLARQRRVPITVNRGQVLDFSLLVENEDGTSYDFTGHTAEMYVYNSFSKTDAPEFTPTVSLSLGEISVANSAITRKKENFVYQIWITDATGYRQVWLNGEFLVLNREVDNEFGADSITISPNGDEIAIAVQVGQNPFKSITVDITPAQVKDIHNTAVLSIPSPGAGKYIRAVNMDLSLIFGSVQYVSVNSPALQLYYDTARTLSAGMAPGGGVLVGTQSRVSTHLESAGLTNRNLSDIENKPIYIMTTSGTASWTTGDGTLRVRISYLIIDI